MCRSTVAFAREVAENKAMDDALNRLEGMFTGTDPREDGLTTRRGDTTTKSGSFTQPSTTSSGEVSIEYMWGISYVVHVSRKGLSIFSYLD